ncbi:MAG TPA: hypothetical protein VJA94_13415 [Candidatus Angelobacter sp.]
MALNRDQILERRRLLKKEYGELYDQLTALLFRHDPAHINFEVNKDEYQIEVDSILPRLGTCQSQPEVEEVIHEEFTRLFDPMTAGPRQKYVAIAAEVWELWQNFNRT